MCKRVSFILVFLFLITNSSFSFQADAISYQKNVEKLKSYFQKSFNNPDSLKYRKLFFEAFPNSFSELDSLYGYHNGKAAPLYDEGVDHIINLFNNLECIPDSVYYKKLINISLRGIWDADAINYFQHGLHQHSLDKPELLFSLLESYSDTEIQSFSYFFYDGIHPPFKEIPTEFEKLEFQYSRVFIQMKKAFKSALSDSKH